MLFFLGLLFPRLDVAFLAEHLPQDFWAVILGKAMTSTSTCDEQPCLEDQSNCEIGHRSFYDERPLCFLA